MAIFNPDVPDTDANYLGLSKPISQPTYTSSKAIKIKAAGDLFAEGVKAADTVVKMTGEAETRSAMEGLRDSYNQQLDQQRTAIRTANVNPASTASDGGYGHVPVGTTQAEGPMDLMPNPNNLPVDIKKLPATLGTLDSARANGKLSETDFYARANTALKDIRSRYPMAYRSYIDDIAKDTLGVDPANAYTKSVLADINSYVTSQQAEKNHLLTFIRSHGGFQDADKAYTMVNRGMWDGEALMREWYYPQAKIDLDRQRRASARSDVEGARKVVAQDWKDDLESYSSDKASEYLRLLRSFNNLPPGQVPSGTAMQGYVLQVQQAKAQYETDMEDYILRPDKYGNSHTKVMGGSQAREVYKSNLALFDSTLSKLTDEKTGYAGAASRMIEAQKKNDQWGLMKNRAIGRSVREISAFEALLSGDESRKFFTRKVSEGLTTDMDDYLKQTYVDAVNEDPNNPKPFIQNFKEARTDKMDMPQTLDGMVKMIHSKTQPSLLNPATPDVMKASFARKAFSTGNFAFIGSLAEDFKDDQGNRIPGKMSVFTNWTSQEVAGEMARLGQADPQLWEMYKNWVKYTTADVFGTDIKNAAEKFPTLPKGAEIAWNSNTHTFGLNYYNTKNINLRDLRGIQYPSVARSQYGRDIDASIPQLAGIVNNLNKVVGGVSNVGRVDAGATDAQAFALETLMNSGIDLSNVQGLPNAVLQSLTAEKKQQLEEEAATESYGRKRKKK